MAPQDKTLESIDEAECHALLKSARVGRVGAIAQGRPIVLPVNFVFDSQSVVLRVGYGSILARSMPQTEVAFEVDNADETNEIGWSVLAQGVAHDITTTIDQHSEALRLLEVTPWAPGDKSTWIAINPHSITGRRLTLT